MQLQADQALLPKQEKLVGKSTERDGRDGWRSCLVGWMERVMSKKKKEESNKDSCVSTIGDKCTAHAYLLTDVLLMSQVVVRCLGPLLNVVCA